MTSRTRFLITAALVCHLLLAPSVVTSQLLSASGKSGAESSPPSAPSKVREQDVTIRALQQEKDGVLYKLRGQAEIHYGTYILHADSVDYNSDTGESIADGHVVLDGGPNDEHVEATHATYNIRAESGRFQHVVGTTGMQLRGKRMILTTENPFAFTGSVVEKTGPDHYVVYDGTITTCELPRPKWEFNAHKIIVEVGGNATIYRSTFRVGGVRFSTFPSPPTRWSGSRGRPGFSSLTSAALRLRERSWEIPYSGPSIAAWTSLREPNISPGAGGRRKYSFAPSPVKNPTCT